MVISLLHPTVVLLGDQTVQTRQISDFGNAADVALACHTFPGINLRRALHEGSWNVPRL